MVRFLLGVVFSLRFLLFPLAFIWLRLGLLWRPPGFGLGCCHWALFLLTLLPSWRRFLLLDHGRLSPIDLWLGYLPLRLLPFRTRCLLLDYGRLSPIDLWLGYLPLRLLPFRTRCLLLDYGGLSPISVWLGYLALRLLPSWDDGPWNRILLGCPPRSSVSRRLNPPDSAHIHDTHRGIRNGRTLAHLLDRGRWKGAAGVLRQRRLLPLERNRGRRRSGAPHDRPA